jgi:hypothetical protein
MAAGIIYQTVTTTSGETVELAFWVDDTVSPTQWKNIAYLDPNSPGVQATAAHDAADTGDPLKIGFKATAALSGLTPVAEGDRTNGFADLDGAMFVRSAALGDTLSGVAAITDGSSTSIIAAQGAGIKTYITDIIVANSSASFVTVDIRDGAAGTVKATVPAPATSGVVHRFATPIPFTANTAVCADPSASASTITVTLLGFKSKI